MQTNSSTLSHRFFTAVTAIPKTSITLGLLIIIGTAAFIPTLTVTTQRK